MKALCSERYDDWNSRFGSLGLKCLELTGDSLVNDYVELQDVHIILTTPVSSCYICCVVGLIRWVAGVQRSSSSVCVRVSLCPHDRTKTCHRDSPL